LKKYIFLLFLCLLIPWSLEAKDKVIKLQYIPREKVKVQPKNVSLEKIYFQEITDLRPSPREIGENKEDKKKPIKILTSEDNEAGSWFLSVLKKEFQGKGFKIETNFNEASKIISLTLLKFWTLEESTYDTEIELKVEFRDNPGDTLFKKTYSSKGTNRGRSLSDVNYNECISDALARMTDNFFSDMEFLRVLAEKPKPPRVEEKPKPPVVEKKPGDVKQAEEKRLEEIKAEIKRLEELKAEEKRARELREAERRAEEKRLEEKRAKETQEAERRAEEKRLEEKRAREKQEEEKRVEERRAEEKRLEELKAEVKKLEEIKALKEEILAEEKRKEEERRAREKRPASPKPKPAEPVFGPK
jgi:hypothetical protein